MDVKYTGEPFNGIISILSQKNRNNFYDAVDVEGIKYDDWADPNILINYSCNLETKECNWVSPSSIDESYFIVNFKKYAIIPSHYTIRTRTDQDENHPLKWEVSVSYDKSEWKLLQSIETNDLCGKGKYATYSIPYPKPIKHIKVSMTGFNGGKHYHFHITRVEFFGMVYTTMNPFNEKSCNYYLEYNSIQIISFLLNSNLF